MKWPSSITLIRHDISAYNILKDKRVNDPLYKDFLASRKDKKNYEETKLLALLVMQKFALGIGDADTPLANEGVQAYKTGLVLSSGKVPDVVFVSPYKRAMFTLGKLIGGWPALAKAKTYEEERIREQEHGLALLYNDWKVFHALHPDQEALYELEGPYWYRYPQGENVPDVRDRNRSWLSTLTRDFAEKDVFVVTHHLNILAMRANLERLSAQDFIFLDKREKPINCGVTVYRGHPDQGKDGKLVLESYNVKHY